MNIYVGNLSYSLWPDELKAVFEPFGMVSSTRIVGDFETGRSFGYGFVEMPNDEEAVKAMAALNGTELKGRRIRCAKGRIRRERKHV